MHRVIIKYSSHRQHTKMYLKSNYNLLCNAVNIEKMQATTNNNTFFKLVMVTLKTLLFICTFDRNKMIRRSMRDMYKHNTYISNNSMNMNNKSVLVKIY